MPDDDSRIEVVSEPARVRAGNIIGVGGAVRLIEAATGKQVDERIGGMIYQNECVERESSSYQDLGKKE